MFLLFSKRAFFFRFHVSFWVFLNLLEGFPSISGGFSTAARVFSSNPSSRLVECHPRPGAARASGEVPGGGGEYFFKRPSKIEWDLTNGPLSKLLELLDTQV